MGTKNGCFMLGLQAEEEEKVPGRKEAVQGGACFSEDWRPSLSLCHQKTSFLPGTLLVLPFLNSNHKTLEISHFS